MEIQKAAEAYRPDPKCKICRLFSRNLEIWQFIHDKVLKEGLARSAVCNHANLKIEEFNKECIVKGNDTLRKLNPQNFFNHFTHHVSADLNELWNLRKLAENTSSSRGYGTLDLNAVQAADDMVTEMIQESQPFNSFATMASMVDTLEAQINNYTIYFQEFAKNNPGKVPDIRLIDTYQKVIAGYLQSKQEVVKIKNSNEVTGKAIESALWKIVSEMSLKIKEVTELTKTRLQDVVALEGTSIPNEISDVIKMQFAEHAKMIVPDIMSQVKKEFGLK